MSKCQACLVICAALAIARGQTLLSFDQASKLGIAWSRGVSGAPRISRLQVRTPGLTFTAAADGVTITGDRHCTIKTKRRPVLLYVMWIKGALAVLGGAFESGSYSPTLEHVDISGDCVPVELNDRAFPAGIQELLYVAIAGMPNNFDNFGGVCVNSMTSYSIGHYTTELQVVGPAISVQTEEGGQVDSKDVCTR